ncbi:MAG TPA: AI-2E family transporter [Ignavibacteria bacterium]|nr:AI-2E family transporter [Ignavibacteria bacterium]
MNTVFGSKTVKIAAGAITAALLYIFLKEFQTILIPFFIAIIISMIFSPLYDIMRRKKIPAVIAIIVILLLIIIIANITSLFVYTSITSFKDAIPKYQSQFTTFFANMNASLQSNQFYNDFLKGSLQLKKFINPATIGSMAESLISGAAGIFGDFILILIYIIFILSEIASIKERMNSVYTDEQYKKVSDIAAKIFEDVKKYIVGKTIINLVHATIVYIILLAFGVDFPVLWAFMTFFMAYIPNIGVIIATILPVTVALIQFQNFIIPAVLLAVLAVIGNLVGNVAEPKIFGSRLNLSPLLLLFSLIFWGYVWGIIGMILSVPIMSMIKITLSNIDGTKNIALMMSNKISEDDKNNNAEKQSKIFNKIRNLKRS